MAAQKPNPTPNNDPGSEKQVSFPARFIPVGRTQRRVGARGKRAPEGANVTKTGRALLNRAGSDLVIDLAIPLYGDLSKCGVFWAADPVSGEIAGRIVPPNVPDVTPIRQNEARTKLTLWLTDIFDKYPNLRPVSNSSVSMTRQPDPEHGDFFIIHLNLALSRTKTTRSSDSTKQSATKQAESKQAESKQAESKQADKQQTSAKAENQPKSAQQDATGSTGQEG